MCTCMCNIMKEEIKLTTFLFGWGLFVTMSLTLVYVVLFQ